MTTEPVSPVRSAPEPAALAEKVREKSLLVNALLAEIRKVIVGQALLVERLVVGLLADGHLLLEGVPGLAKTMAVRTLSRGLDVSFDRIQFTPDLLPADLDRHADLSTRRPEFSTRKGADLREHHPRRRDQPRPVEGPVGAPRGDAGAAGHDRRRDARRSPEPFLVLATQNPIEQEGTYPLPEAQVDRFLLKVKIGYPTKAEEKQILERMGETTEAAGVGFRPSDPRPRLDPGAAGLVRSLYADQRLKNYLVELVSATRDPKSYKLAELGDFVAYGASPRATLALLAAARAHAFLGRGYVVPEDVQRRARRPPPPRPPLLRGRGGRRDERPGRLADPRARRGPLRPGPPPCCPGTSPARSTGSGSGRTGS